MTSVISSYLCAKVSGKQVGGVKRDDVQCSMCSMALYYVQHTWTSWQSFSPEQGVEESDIVQQTEQESPCHFQNLQPGGRGKKEKHRDIMISTLRQRRR